MFKKIACLFLILGMASAAPAQTLQQLEMIKNRQSGTTEKTTKAAPTTKIWSDKGPGYFSKELLDRAKAQGVDAARKQAALDAAANATQAPVFVPKTVDEALALMEGKLVVRTGNVQIIKTAGGQTLCTLDIGMINLTKFDVQDVTVYFGWGDVETFGGFSGLKYNEQQKSNIGLAGSVCDRLGSVPRIRITSCKLKGQTDQFCRSVILLAQE